MKRFFDIKDLDQLTLFPIDPEALDLPVEEHREEIKEALLKTL